MEKGAGWRVGEGSEWMKRKAGQNGGRGRDGRGREEEGMGLEGRRMESGKRRDKCRSSKTNKRRGSTEEEEEVGNGKV